MPTTRNLARYPVFRVSAVATGTRPLGMGGAFYAVSQTTNLLVVFPNRVDALQKLRDLVIHQGFQLTVSNTVPVHNDAGRHLVVVRVPGPQSGLKRKRWQNSGLL